MQSTRNPIKKAIQDIVAEDLIDDAVITHADILAMGGSPTYKSENLYWRNAFRIYNRINGDTQDMCCKDCAMSVWAWLCDFVNDHQ